MKHRTYCGICGSIDLTLALDLGEMPLANAFLTKEELKKPESKYPLKVYLCRQCFTLQLLDIVDPGILFRKYEYLTSASKPLSDHFKKMGHELVDKFINSSDELVVEIGGNDGVLLNAVKNKCLPQNVEPAINIAKMSRQRAIHTRCKFFDIEEADAILDFCGNAKLVIANNVMAHIDNLKETFFAVKKLLSDDGVFVFEVHWLGNLLQGGGFDQIYHEHLYYHSLTSLTRLCELIGFVIFHVEKVPIHGESLRVYCSKAGEESFEVTKLRMEEWGMGINKPETYYKFSNNIMRIKKDLKYVLELSEFDGKKIVGYGAPAKGNTLLNYFDIDLDYIVDTTPGKQGLYTPGKHIEVSPPARLKEERPDVVLILAWNYSDTILNKEKLLRDTGTKFIIPIPEVRIV